jgi:hypothetical protein
MAGVLLRQNIPGPTKVFEAPGVNDLWVVDFSPGAALGLTPARKSRFINPLVLARRTRKKPAGYSAGFRVRAGRWLWIGHLVFHPVTLAFQKHRFGMV